MKYSVVSIFVLALCVVVFAGCVPLSPGDTAGVPETPGPNIAPTIPYTLEQPAVILHLDSYHAEYLWSQNLTAGIEAGLSEFGYDVNSPQVLFQHFYMDTKRNTSPEYLEEIAQQAIDAILQSPPDVVIVTDENAIRRVILPLKDSGVPFVFSGLNGDPDTLGLVASQHVTGVLERIHIEESLNWIHRVFPDAERVLGIYDDSVTTSSYFNTIEAGIADSIFAQHATFRRTNSFAEWQSFVLDEVNAQDVMLLGTYHTLHDEAGQAVHEDDVIAWTLDHSPGPIVALWEFGVYQGALGGSVISGESQGYEAGRLAAQILNGAAPSDLPIVTPPRGRLMLNSDALQRWNVTIPLNLVEISTVFGQ